MKRRILMSQRIEDTPVLRHCKPMTYWVYKGQSMMYPNLTWFKISSIKPSNEKNSLREVLKKTMTLIEVPTVHSNIEHEYM